MRGSRSAWTWNYKKNEVIPRVNINKTLLLWQRIFLVKKFVSSWLTSW